MKKTHKVNNIRRTEKKHSKEVQILTKLLLYAGKCDFCNSVPVCLWAEEHYQTDYGHINSYKITYNMKNGSGWLRNDVNRVHHRM